MRALDFAAWAHSSQRRKGGAREPYVNHLTEVARLVAQATDAKDDVLIIAALLHDVLEDTATRYATLLAEFGQAVADGVSALSKDASLPKAAQMADSLQRIRQQPQEVWLVKLADRISNLQYVPPHWSVVKAAAYREEAQVIADTLGAACPSLRERLLEHIQRYG